MTCFEWQSRTSDYLDGALNASLKREADAHLESCPRCNEQYNRFRRLLTCISSLPRNSLPVTVRKAPFSAPAGQSKRIPLRERLAQWANTPWYLRVPVEGAGIVLAISLAISAGPRLRTLYEKRVEKSLNEYNEGFGTTETPEAATAPQLGRGNLALGKNAGADAESASDDFSGGEEEAESPQLVKAGASETWRFNLKTDSPQEFRTKIVKILTGLKIPETTAGIGGIEAPGGIQFDLTVPQSIIPSLKQALERIAPPAPKDVADSPFAETFTWYKKKSKTPLPAGQTHLVIWLAQI